MSHWLRNTWLGSEPVEFESAYGMAESVERLKAATRRFSIWSSVGHQVAAGSVKESRVSLQRAIPMVGNSFKPFFIGRFAWRDGRVVLAGRFRMHPFVRIFMALWFGGAGFAIATFVMAAGHARRGSLFVPPAAGILLAGIGMVSLGGWFSRNDPAWLSTVIRGALAGPGPEMTAPCGLAVDARIAGNRPPRAIALAAGFLAVAGAMAIASGVAGAQAFGAGPVGTVGAYFTDPVYRPLGALQGALLLGLSYGVYRRYLLAWRAGFVVLLLAQAVFALGFRPDRQGSHVFVESLLPIAASLVATLFWGRWWYAQREHFGK